MAYSIYCLTNTVNNKKYIGVTSQNPHARWQNGKHYSRHKTIYADILLYGWESFDKEILYTDLTETEAKEKEAQLIKELDLMRVGYNRRRGGHIPKLSEDSKEKLSIKNKGENNPFYNKKHTEQAKKLMSESRPKKSVRCIDDGVIYKSTREAERITGAYHGDISKCCKGKLNIAGGHRWEYAKNEV